MAGKIEMLPFLSFMIPYIEAITPSSLFITACVIWSSGAVLTVVSDLTKLRLEDRWMTGLSIAGSLATIVGSIKSYSQAQAFGFSGFPNFGLAPLTCLTDSLSVPFTLLLGLVSLAAALATPSFTHTLATKSQHNHFFRLTFLMLSGILMVLLSANAIAFLVFWEVMSVAAASLITTDHIRHRAQRAAISYMTASRISTALFTAAFLWMQHLSGSFDFSAWHFDDPRALPAAILLFLGAATKAGLWPMHVYLPQSYAEAPGPAAAVLSGVVGKTAIYLLLRLLIQGNCDSLPVIYLALALGTVSCVWGVLFALVERDLKRLLAFSSVENMGLIMVAVALTMLARHHGLDMVMAIAVTGVLFHAFNHGLFKSLLMLGAASVERATHTRELSQLGGLAKRMPWTMLGFFVGSMSICAMPATNGFASKWLIYQAFFRLACDEAPLFDRAIALAMVGVLAFVGALALACYAKAIGIAFLGRPRSRQAQMPPESGIDNLAAAQILLSCLCILLGTSAGISLSAFSPALTLLTQCSNDTGSFFPLAIGQLSLVGVFLTSAIYLIILGPKTKDIKTYITWDCGYGPLSARAEETGSSFSHPIGRIFSQILQLNVETEIQGKDRRHFPEAIRVETKMSPFIETKAYRRFLDVVNWLSLTLTRLQTGSIHVHLLYLFLTMIVLVLLGTTL